jgi:hypothetical protein
LRCLDVTSEFQAQTPRTFDGLKAGEKLFLLVGLLVSLAAPLRGQEVSIVDDPSQAQPYMDQPLEQLVKLVPDLKKLQPAPDQQLLPIILQKSGATVDDFVYNVVDVIAREKITQERLNTAGYVRASEHMQDDYLILHSGNDVREALAEYRMDVGSVGLNKGYPFTSGFALTCLYFSTARQSDSTFRYLGQQTLGNRQTYVVAFAQISSHATFSVTMPGRPDGVRCSFRK